MEFERGFCDAIIVGAITLGALILPIIIDRSAEIVGPLARNGVDDGAGEIALLYVIRGDLDLDLVDGVQRDGLGVGLTSERAGKTEGVVEVGSVHGDVV